jgi:hypothetical protein
MRAWRPALAARTEQLAEAQRVAQVKGTGTTSKSGSIDSSRSIFGNASSPDLTGLSFIANAASSVEAQWSVMDSTSVASGLGLTGSNIHRTFPDGGSKSLHSYTACVPRSGRSYMIKPEVKECSDGSAVTTDGSSASVDSTTNSTQHPSAHSCPSESSVDMLAASALALSIASNYQTPHSYNGAGGGRKYKSGGSGGKTKNKLTATSVKLEGEIKEE